MVSFSRATEKLRPYLKSKAFFGAIFLLSVCAVFLFVILQSNLFSITVDGRKSTIVTVRDDCDGIIRMCGITVNDGDEVSFTPAVRGKAGSLVIRRAFDVFVTADGVTRSLTIVEGTVRDALDAFGISLGEHDEVSPQLDSHLFSQLDVTVKRINYSTRIENETVKYETKEFRSIYTLKGTTQVAQKGSNGLIETTYRDKYIDGVLESSSVIDVVTRKQPVDKIIAIGIATQEQLDNYATLASYGSEPPKDYIAVYEFIGTAYTYSSIEKYNVTACGTPVREGAVAVDPTVIPYGTKLYVVSSDGTVVYGYCVAEDTGPGIKGKRIDLFFESKTTVYNFGRRAVKIYVLG